MRVALCRFVILDFSSILQTRALSFAKLRRQAHRVQATQLDLGRLGHQVLRAEAVRCEVERASDGEHFEELPGEGALAELPASILREMSEALKLELKIEQLVKG